MKAMDRKAIPRRQYSEEFKREAVRLVEEGLSLCEVGRRLDVTNQSIGHWVKRFRGEAEKTPAVGSGDALHAELSRLRAENARLKLDKEILKKAAAYFAKELP